MNLFILSIILSVLVCAYGFQVLKVNKLMSTYKSKMVMLSDKEPSPAYEAQADKKLFDMNKNVRLGRSRDQDGKSNIWSIEPAMEVAEEEDADESSPINKNLVIGGAVIGVALACLPVFNALSSLFPDPSDY
jgi:hypothetical protein